MIAIHPALSCHKVVTSEAKYVPEENGERWNFAFSWLLISLSGSH